MGNSKGTFALAHSFFRPFRVIAFDSPFRFTTNARHTSSRFICPSPATWAAPSILSNSSTCSGSVSPVCLSSFNPLVQPLAGPGGTWVVPPFNLQSGQPFDLNAFTQLKSLEIDAKDAVSLGLINDFCTAWIANIVLNQPIRMNRDTLNCEIGHRLYKDAKAVW